MDRVWREREWFGCETIALIVILNNLARLLKPRGECKMLGDTHPKMRGWKIDKDFVACAGYGSGLKSG